MSSVASDRSSVKTLPSTAFAAPWAKKALLVGIAGLVFALITLFLDPSTRSFHGWMIGLVFWIAIAIGILMLVFLHYLFDAGWSVVLRRQYEHALAAIPWLALGAIPLLIATYVLPQEQSGVVWVWMNPDAEVVASPAHHGVSTVAEDSLYTHKESFLQREFFVVRTIAYFAIFSFFACKLRKFSFNMDVDGQPRWMHLSRKYAAAGVIAVSLSMAFFSFDWMMSINYHWFSTMFPVWFFSLSVKAGLSLAIIFYSVQITRGHLQGYGNIAHLYLMGSLLLAFTMFWAYVTFSQYFLIYSANIPEETFWYVIREKAGWWEAGLILVFGGFFLPFFALLRYKTKVEPKTLSAVAIWTLLMTVVDLYYNILPQKILAENEYGYTVPTFSAGLTEIGAIIGFGGIFFWAFFTSMARHKAIPTRDPRILESINYHQ